MSDKFLYQDKEAVYDSILGCVDRIVGGKYHQGAVVIDWRLPDDDHLDLLMVESPEDGDDYDHQPFVAIRVSLDALDVRTELWREDSLRYAINMWESDQ